jgi:hypothetical protein
MGAAAETSRPFLLAAQSGRASKYQPPVRSGRALIRTPPIRTEPDWRTVTSCNAAWRWAGVALDLLAEQGQLFHGGLIAAEALPSEAKQGHGASTDRGSKRTLSQDARKAAD